MKPWSLGAPPPGFRQEAVLHSEAPNGLYRQALSREPGAASQEPVGHQDPGSKAHLNLFTSYKMPRPLQSNKSALKREAGSSRCGLEEAVVTGQPG